MSPYFVVTWRGEQLQTVATWKELIKLLGPVDTIAEAALHVLLHRYQIDCELSTGEARGQDWVVTGITGHGCGAGEDVLGHVLLVHRDGTIATLSKTLLQPGNPNCEFGRRPPGWTHETVVEASDVAAYFARARSLEAASVVAFEHIARVLEMHRAPAGLIERARRAARDEVRHTRIMNDLALRFGAEPAREVDLVYDASDDLFAFASNNATEGCVRETFAALLAWEQARATTDPTIARAMRILARDETRHAALSWDLAQWVEPQLGAAQRLEVERLRDREFELLDAALEHPPAAALHELVGIPLAARARELLAGMRAGLLEMAA